MGMQIAGAVQMSGQAVITLIQTINKNKTRLKFQAQHAQVFVQGVISRAGRKQAQKQIQQVK